MNKMLFAAFLFSILFIRTVFAGPDEVKLKSGTVYKGAIVARNDQEIYFNDGERVHRVNLNDIESITFGPKPPDEQGKV